jgi:transposase
MHRFDLQDWQWELICDLFPSNAGKEGGQWRDHRTVLNGMFHVLHTGCPWRDLPERYGPWQTAFDRFNRYRGDGTFDLILQRLRARLDRLGRIDWDYWCFDGTSVRAARCAAGAKKHRAIKPSAKAAAGSAASCT